MKRILISLSLIFITQSVWADYITQNTINGCDDSVIGIDNNNHSNMFAIFAPTQYTCSSGQYLPANIDGCRTCPANGTCSGGTYTFNESSSSGIEFRYPFTQSQTNACVNDLMGADNNNHSNMFAVFTPNQHTCSPGYYLPANTDGCTICPSGNKCIGGTYTFNETSAQGIEPCQVSAQHTPAGSAICYSRILHLSRENPNDIVYLKDTATTTPAFHVSFNGNTFYANLTTTPTYITSVSTRYLTVMVDNVEYYVCDDTTCPQ